MVARNTDYQDRVGTLCREVICVVEPAFWQRVTRHVDVWGEDIVGHLGAAHQPRHPGFSHVIEQADHIGIEGKRVTGHDVHREVHGSFGRQILGQYVDRVLIAKECQCDRVEHVPAPHMALVERAHQEPIQRVSRDDGRITRDQRLAVELVEDLDEGVLRGERTHLDDVCVHRAAGVGERGKRIGDGDLLIELMDRAGPFRVLRTIEHHPAHALGEDARICRTQHGAVGVAQVVEPLLIHQVPQEFHVAGYLHRSHGASERVRRDALSDLHRTQL